MIGHGLLRNAKHTRGLSPGQASLKMTTYGVASMNAHIRRRRGELNRYGFGSWNRRRRRSSQAGNVVADSRAREVEDLRDLALAATCLEQAFDLLARIRHEHMFSSSPDGTADPNRYAVTFRCGVV